MGGFLHKLKGFVLSSLLIITIALSGCLSEEVPIQTENPLTTSVPQTTSSTTTTTTTSSTSLSSTTSSTSTTITSLPPKPSATAQYQLTFTSTWSKETHPQDFPENPHYSALIGAAHSREAKLWEEGELATPGIKNMAENGINTPLDNEINALIDQDLACDLYTGASLRPSPTSITLNFTIDPECSFVTFVTMIAPSPDWFIGVSGLDLSSNGDWAEKVVVDLIAYDAGTDSGATYTSPDKRTEEPEPIQSINYPPLSVAGTPPKMGTFTFTRLE